MPVAVLDFGTNTFNLLIAEPKHSTFRILYTGKQAVKIGKGGIHKKIISPDAMERGRKAIAAHMETISKYGASEIHAYATSAIRNAENGKVFVERIRDEFGFETNIIDGSREAELIYKGIRASVDLQDRILILDIGGGSNEFIICDANGILWKHSFELGMARIIEKFSLSDPIKENEIQALEKYFQDELAILFENVNRFQPTVLVGASGTFDTLAAMARSKYNQNTDYGSSSLELKMEHYRVIHQSLLHSNAEDRLAMPGMEPVRVEMIVPATIFITFVLKNCELKKLIQSSYALKEGVMAELVNQ
ncbi:phosphatase [Bacteroidota bacterium]